MANFIRSLGALAGGVAGGYNAGTKLNLDQQRVDIAKKTADQEVKASDFKVQQQQSEVDAYKKLGGMLDSIFPGGQFSPEGYQKYMSDRAGQDKQYAADRAQEKVGGRNPALTAAQAAVPALQRPGTPMLGQSPDVAGVGESPPTPMFTAPPTQPAMRRAPRTLPFLQDQIGE